MNKRKLAIFDLDGTLFDTKDVNYFAYREAIKCCGFSAEIDYGFYCSYCNGNHYKEFLPVIIPGISESEMRKIHEYKKKVYAEYLPYAKKNHSLFDLISSIKSDYKTALVTSASRKNVNDILGTFQVYGLFDFIVTQNDVKRCKPDPEGFLKVIKESGVSLDRTIIFEDSKTGIIAAKQSGANYVQVFGWN